jgi:tRNA nucleotidyltransferase/poly(A) polymerase
MPTRSQLESAVRLIGDVVSRYGMQDVFFVGGYPRAMAMGLGWSDVKDLDVASGTPEKATQLAGLVAEEGDAEAYETRHRTRTVTIEVDGVEMDFQGPMSHDEVLPYLHSWGVEPTPIATNVFDRDFTINSLIIPIGEERIVDLTGRAQDDIDDERIATILPPRVAIRRSPLIITRAIRFSHKYGYKIDGSLWKAMKEGVGGLADLPEGRLAIEAYVLSKYDCEDMLEELGLSDMASQEEIEKGEEIAER